LHNVFTIYKIMKAKKILFITQEITPFVPESERALIGRNLPQAIQERGHEIRTFTPKWGIINERRNQLHEVIRLSGMNLIIDETDHPLIIKVSSIQAARMQIYFIDNDDYFQKRTMTCDPDGNEYEDNGERAIFYARGVLETVKKLRWVPDVIHCDGWITALAPIFIKKAYKDEPSFQNAKVVFTATSKEFQNDLGEHFADCLPFKDICKEDFEDVCNGKFGHTELSKIAVKYSDGLILGDEGVDPAIAEYAKSLNLPILENQSEETYRDAYNSFYETVMD